MKQLDATQFEELKNILEKEFNCSAKLTNNTLFNDIGIYDEENCEQFEIFIKAFGDKLILKRIYFSKTKNGYGTIVLQWLKKYCINNGFKILEIESSISECMFYFCKKHNFKPIMSSGFITDGIFYGNWQIVIDC